MLCMYWSNNINIIEPIIIYYISSNITLEEFLKILMHFLLFYFHLQVRVICLKFQQRTLLYLHYYKYGNIETTWAFILAPSKYT